MQNMQGSGFGTATETENTNDTSTIESTSCRSEGGEVNQKNCRVLHTN